MNVVPFACSECGASFHELEGGICLVCGRLLCRRHLTLRRAGAICRRCLGEDDVKTTFESSVSNEDQQRVVRLLEMDVAATIGDNHRNEIAEVACWVRVFADTPDDYEQRLVDDLQQWFHDAFIDTSWPNCPDHPHHPLWFSHGWWRCEQSEKRVAKLGALAKSSKKTAG
jgi:hypothetical protein